MLSKLFHRCLGVGLALALGLSAACHKDPIVEAKKFVESGDKYAADGKLKEALVEYKNAVQVNGQDGEARLKVAGVAMKLGDNQTALREYIRAADLLPSSADAQIRAGNMLLLTSQFEDAKSRADHALAVAPQSADALMLRGNAMAGLKDLDGAMAQIQEAIKVDPDGSVAYYDLGALQFAHGERSAAEASFRRAVEVAPKFVPAHLALANFLWASGQRDKVEDVLKNALTLEPKSVVVNRALAYLYLALNRKADAEAPLKIVAAESKDPTARLMLSDYYEATNRVPDAIAILDALAAEPANYALARSKKAALLFATGKRADAYALIDETLKKEPKNDTALLIKSNFLLADKRSDEALATAQSARTAAPNSPVAAFAVGRIQALRGEWSDATQSLIATLKLAPGLVPAQIQLAQIYLGSGQPDQALHIVENTLAAQRGNITATLIKSRALIATGNVIGAESTLNALPPQLLGAPVVQTQLGMLYILKRNEASARKAFETALKSDPDNLEALTGITRLDFGTRKGADAEARLNAALVRQPHSAPLLVLAAQADLGLDKNDEAERRLKLAAEVDPKNLQAYSMLGALYAREKRVDEAIGQFERLSTQKSSAVVGDTMIGILNEVKGDRDAARKRYEHAMSVDPAAGVAANNLAMIMVDTGGNLDVALKLAQTAKKQLAGVATVNDTLGIIYYRKGLNPLAIDAYREALAKEPDNAGFLGHMGLAYAKAGEMVKAKESLQKAFSIAQNFPDAAEAKAMLATLK